MSYLTCTEAANIAHCSTQVIRKLIKSGKLGAYKLGKHYLIKFEDLVTCIESHKK